MIAQCDLCNLYHNLSITRFFFWGGGGGGGGGKKEVKKGDNEDRFIPLSLFLNNS